MKGPQVYEAHTEKMGHRTNVHHYFLSFPLILTFSFVFNWLPRKISVWEKPLTLRTFYTSTWESHVLWWKDDGPLSGRLRVTNSPGLFAQLRAEESLGFF